MGERNYSALPSFVVSAGDCLCIVGEKVFCLLPCPNAFFGSDAFYMLVNAGDCLCIVGEKVLRLLLCPNAIFGSDAFHLLWLEFC